MEERTVIISSRELVDHAVLTRRRNELAFKKDLVVRTGAKTGDLHLKALEDELFLVEEKLHPIAEKVSTADMITFVPARKEIGEYTLKINQFSREQLETAVKSKNGEAYELMKKRAVLVKNNFECKEDVARLTILLNSAPRKEAESLRGLLEEGQGEDADVSFFPKETQQELLNLASRLGRQCCILAGSLTIDKKKAELNSLKPDVEVLRLLQPGARRVWVKAANIADFEANEKNLSETLAKIQAKGAEKQARAFNDEENAFFDKLQNDYIEAKRKRAELARGIELNETVKLYKKNLPAAQEDPIL